MIFAVFTMHYWANLSEIFGKVLKTVGNLSIICAVSRYDFRLETSLGILENLVIGILIMLYLVYKHSHFQ